MDKWYKTKCINVGAFVEKLQEKSDYLFQKYIDATKEEHHNDSICLELEKNWQGEGSIYQDSTYKHFYDQKMLWMDIGIRHLQLSNQVAEKIQKVELGLE